MRFLLRHPLIRTLANLRGNSRVCVYTEPMWGLSLNLVTPYMPVFMLALGLNDAEVGAVASIYMGSQIVFAFLSGALTDKLGRRVAVTVFDALAWCAPCVIWLFAADFKFFVVAALCNGAMRVPTNAWGCLLIEDADKGQITHIFTWIMIFGNLSALFSPISSIMISRLTLIPAVRILIVNALAVFSIKLVLLYKATKETSIGLARMREARGQSYASLLKGYSGVLKQMRKSRGLVFSIAVASLVTIITMVNTTFWQIIANKKLSIPDSSLPLFTMLRSLLALFFYFTVISRVSQVKLKNPLLLGFASYFAGQAILISIPSGGSPYYIMLCVSLVFDGFGASMLGMLSESMIAIHAGEAERARVLAIYQMIVMAICAPFGWIGGMLSGVSRNLPFILNLTLIAAGAALTLAHFRAKQNLP